MDAAVSHVSESAQGLQVRGLKVFMVGRRKAPLSFFEALASLQSLDPWNAKGVQRELYCMALVLASRSEYFGNASNSISFSQSTFFSEIS